MTAPGRATDRIATGARHATRTIPGVGETLTAEMRGTGAMGRLDTETVCSEVTQDPTRSTLLTFFKILAGDLHRPDAAAVLPLQTCPTEAKAAPTGPTQTPPCHSRSHVKKASVIAVAQGARRKRLTTMIANGVAGETMTMKVLNRWTRTKRTSMSRTAAWTTIWPR